MSTRYIEIDSSWRNRTLYPNPSNFEVPISESGAKLSGDALSPVCCSSPILEWKLGNFNIIEPATVAERKYVKIEVTQYLGGEIYQVAQATGNILQDISDYYACATITDNDDPALQTVNGRIVKYNYLGNGTATLVLNTSLSGITAGSNLWIFDSTYLSIDASGKFNLVDPYIFVPTGFPGTNAYNDFLIENTTRGQTRPTTLYNGVTKLLGIDISESPVSTQNAGPIDDWCDTDVLTLRQITTQAQFIPGPIANEFLSPDLYPGGMLMPPPPLSSINELSKTVFQTKITDALEIPQVGNFLEKLPFYTKLNTTLTIDSISTLSYMPVAGGSEDAFYIPDYFAGAKIFMFNAVAPLEYINKQIREIASSMYDQATGKVILFLKNDFTYDAAATLPTGQNAECSVNIPPDFSRITKYVNLESTVGMNSTVDYIEFPLYASEENNFYNDLYINILVNTAAPGDPPVYTTFTRIIKEYVVQFNQFGSAGLRGAILNRPITLAPNSTSLFWISSGIVATPFNTFIAATSNTPVSIFNEIRFSVLPFSYDGFNPFVYSGSRVSQQEMVCYAIELKNLVLPNQVLDGGFGSLIPFYPYIYVELQNVSASGAGLNNVIYSNNPNSSKMLFRVPITDVPNPVNSTYIKLDSRGAVQTIKFKPNDNLKFGVYLCDGTPFETFIKDNKPPKKPNPLVQISALFSIKRID